MRFHDPLGLCHRRDLMQHVKNRVRDEHPSRESCYKSSSNACLRRFAASYIAQRPQAIEFVP
jgi:hypothetical protein